MDEYINKLDAMRKLGKNVPEKDLQAMTDNLYYANLNKQNNYSKNE